MKEKTDLDKFLEYIPSLTIWYKVLLLYFFQLIIFILIMSLFWWISSKIFYGAILIQLIVSTLLVFFYIYLANNAEKIRKKYREKYDKLAGQAFWYHYQSYTIPIISAVFYFPLFLITYDFLPYHIIKMPSENIITTPLLPDYYGVISLILGVILIITGLLMRRFSGGYSMLVDDYLYVVFPEKSTLISDGMYQYIRNPQYVCRGIIAIGFGFIANNISAILIGFIHFISYCAIIPAEDRELTRRFGDKFLNYKKKVPMLFPRYRNWKIFVKYIFFKEKEN